jgi:Ubiquitin-activating enzyme E1 FCCH domain
MSGFQQVMIGGYPGGGLTQDKKPALLANEAYSDLENAYVFRERTKKRDGEVPMGRLTRILSNISLGNSSSSPWTFNLFSFVSGLSGVVTAITNANPGQITSTAHGLISGMQVRFIGVGGMTQLNGNIYTVTVVDDNNFTIGVDTTAYGAYTSGGIWINEPGAEFVAGSVIINMGGVIFTDQGNGILTSITPGNSGVINYITGQITLTTTVTAGTAATASFNYYPSLPVMGIIKRDVSTFGIDSTVFFDTKYAYQYVNGFIELAPGTTWTGTNTDFFWAANYQGATPDLRYFFTTNNNIDILAEIYDPIRYYNNSTWTNLQPLLTMTITLWQSLILIPYYGRLLALNTWEGPTDSGYNGATNFFSRCRFSQIGDPTDQTNGWRSDIFGRGGFIDAPTNEAIVSAAFFRNTLIVFFEYSTWQLRYIGEYGLPFIFERISSDFGSVSTYSTIVFDQGVIAISDRGIIQAAANGITRLDDQIPEQVFSFEIQNSAPNFVHGIRDFEKELAYWNYVDTSNDSTNQSYPNTVLVFNYRNNTWAKFRDTITCFGTAQFKFGITWDSLTTFWESNVSWDNVDDQQYVDYVTAGTQQGFINIYQNPDAETPQAVTTLYANTMAITAVNFGANPTILIIPNHNLANGEIIYIQNTIWMGTDPGLNNVIYCVMVVDANTITLATWDFVSQNYTAVNIISSSVYLGGGRITLFPKMNIQGKDFNPFQGEGMQFKLSYIDFQMDANIESPAITATTIQLFVNSYLEEQANLLATNDSLVNSALNNSSQNSRFITNATQSNPCQINSPNHGLIPGTLIYIGGVEGMTQLNSAIYSITVVDANNFTLDNTDSSGFSAYSKGGVWNTNPVNGQTYIPGSQYAWYRFYSTQFGQYLRVGLTYDDNLMNQLATHQTPMELNAMNLWFRHGGRLIN